MHSTPHSAPAERSASEAILILHNRPFEQSAAAQGIPALLLVPGEPRLTRLRP